MEAPKSLITDCSHWRTLFCCSGILLDDMNWLTASRMGETPIFSHRVDSRSFTMEPNFLSWI